LTAWVPLGFATAAVALLVGFLVTGPHAPALVNDHGIVRHDEGVAAHIWQLLMVLQVAAILLFAALWLPRDPKRAGVMLALQMLGLVAACVPLYLAEHGYLGQPVQAEVR
jgi:hypothetical protein